IWKVAQKSKYIPDVSSHICHCQKKSNCKDHHVDPTPLILHHRLRLASLTFTVIRQLDVMYNYRGLLKKEQHEKVSGIQRRWAENLVQFHIRYQSPQISCPEITQMVLSELPKYTRSGL